MERGWNCGNEVTGLDKEQVKYCLKVMGAFGHCTDEVKTNMIELNVFMNMFVDTKGNVQCIVVVSGM